MRYLVELLDVEEDRHVDTSLLGERPDSLGPHSRVRRGQGSQAIRSRGIPGAPRPTRGHAAVTLQLPLGGSLRRSSTAAIEDPRGRIWLSWSRQLLPDLVCCSAGRVPK